MKILMRKYLQNSDERWLGRLQGASTKWEAVVMNSSEKWSDLRCVLKKDNRISDGKDMGIRKGRYES